MPSLAYPLSTNPPTPFYITLLSSLLLSLSSLLLSLSSSGDYDNAIELHESLLVARHRLHGKYHPSVVLSSLALADTLRLSLRRHLYK